MSSCCERCGHGASKDDRADRDRDHCEDDRKRRCLRVVVIRNHEVERSSPECCKRERWIRTKVLAMPEWCITAELRGKKIVTRGSECGRQCDEECENWKFGRATLPCERQPKGYRYDKQEEPRKSERKRERQRHDDEQRTEADSSRRV